MPALPTNALRRNGAAMASVAVAQLLEQGGDRLAVVGGDAGAERLVGAVLAPGLGKGLQLDIGRMTPDRSEVVGDGVQLGEVERQAAFAVERFEPVVVETGDVDQFDVGAGSGFRVDERRLDRAERPTFDHSVGQQPLGEKGQGGVVGIALDLIARASGDRGDRRPDGVGGQGDCLSRGIGHTRKQCGLDRLRVRDRPLAGLQQRIDEELLQLRTVAATGDEHQVSDVDRGDPGQPECVRIGQ